MKTWGDIMVEVNTDKVDMLKEVLRDTKDKELKIWLNSRVKHYQKEIERINKYIIKER